MFSKQSYTLRKVHSAEPQFGCSKSLHATHKAHHTLAEQPGTASRTCAAFARNTSRSHRSLQMGAIAELESSSPNIPPPSPPAAASWPSALQSTLQPGLHHIARVLSAHALTSPTQSLFWIARRQSTVSRLTARLQRLPVVCFAAHAELNLRSTRRVPAALTELRCFSFQRGRALAEAVAWFCRSFSSGLPKDMRKC